MTPRTQDVSTRDVNQVEGMTTFFRCRRGLQKKEYNQHNKTGGEKTDGDPGWSAGMDYLEAHQSQLIPKWTWHSGCASLLGEWLSCDDLTSQKLRGRTGRGGGTLGGMGA